MWWEKTEESLPIGAKILSLILYSDATNVISLGKSSLHPIYVSIGNIKNWRRNKPDAKQLLGYLPILESKDNSKKQKDKFKNAARESFHKSLELLLDPLLKLNNGIDLTLNSNTIWFYPRVSVIIADWPEAARSEEHTSELQSHHDLVCRLLLEKKNKRKTGTLSV